MKYIYTILLLKITVQPNDTSYYMKSFTTHWSYFMSCILIIAYEVFEAFQLLLFVTTLSCSFYLIYTNFIAVHVKIDPLPNIPYIWIFSHIILFEFDWTKYKEFIEKIFVFKFFKLFISYLLWCTTANSHFALAFFNSTSPYFSQPMFLF